MINSDIYNIRYKNLLKDDFPIHWSAKIGKEVRIGISVVIENRCDIGDDCLIGHNTVIRSDVKIGKNSTIGHNVVIESDTVIGEHVTIQSQCHITKFATIGDRCFFGPKAMCINTQKISHGRKFEPNLKGPVFEFGCRIGAGAIIMPGVKVGRECEIGAGSLITRNCDEFCTYFGAPARKRRKIPDEERL